MFEICPDPDTLVQIMIGSSKSPPAAAAVAAVGAAVGGVEDASKSRGFLLRDGSIISEFVFKEYIRDFLGAGQQSSSDHGALLEFVLAALGFSDDPEDQTHARRVFFNHMALLASDKGAAVEAASFTCFSCRQQVAFWTDVDVQLSTCTHALCQACLTHQCGCEPAVCVCVVELNPRDIRILCGSDLAGMCMFSS